MREEERREIKRKSPLLHRGDVESVFRMWLFWGTGLCSMIGFFKFLLHTPLGKKIIVVAKQFIINSFSVLNLLYTLYVYSITIL